MTATTENKKENKNNYYGAPKVGTFKGKPVLILNPDSKFPFSFGVSKAKTILENIEHIKSFVESMKDKNADM